MRIPGTPRTRAALVATASAALVLSPAAAHARAVDDTKLVPHSHFVMQADGSSGNTAHGATIPNIDIVKKTIRTYYNAPSGIADKTQSPYITEMKQIEADTLADATLLPRVDPADNKAVVFDADDTTLWTYDMEDGNPADPNRPGMHFIFNPTLQDKWVQNGWFPATPGMVQFVHDVAAKGYHIYGITGRNSAQEAATLTNLEDQGYTEFNADNFYTKWTGDSTHPPLPKPDYVDCTADGSAADSCSTVEYKAFTRKHIEEADGMDIVLNVGDQFSDLQGGYADQSLKLPNPTYYLASTNIPGAPASDADLTPRTEFTMLPDYSSGLTEGGEGIPNVDIVKSTIRTYYAADATHKANKTSSPYISEMSSFSEKWAEKLANSCTKGVRNHEKPAVVFDADDTTLWTYDMEDGAMGFDFNPTLQDQWVKDESFPAVPGMPRVVHAAAKAGCKIVGITGRTGDQRLATIDNLNRYYDGAFESRYYFTKPGKTGQFEPYVDCAMDTDPTKCSTIEYKSSTRKYVEDHFGFHIIANFGDQFSDLIGGSSERVAKLPNPTYYLP
jgi:predicted secreted acid phosphatase